MSNKRDYPPYEQKDAIKILPLLGIMVIFWILIALSACWISHSWTWEFFGKVVGIQVAICYVVGEIYAMIWLPMR